MRGKDRFNGLNMRGETWYESAYSKVKQGVAAAVRDICVLPSFSFKVELVVGRPR